MERLQVAKKYRAEIRRRNPTVLIWSVPTKSWRDQAAAVFPLSQSHRTDLVSSYSSLRLRRASPSQL
jgi:hypothetical protein